MIRRWFTAILLAIAGFVLWLLWQERPPKPVLKPVRQDYSKQFDNVQVVPPPQSHTLKIDDLTQISGIGPVFESALNDAGIHSFLQLSQQSPDELADKLNSRISVDRIVRDQWIQQARDYINGRDLSDE